MSSAGRSAGAVPIRRVARSAAATMVVAIAAMTSLTGCVLGLGPVVPQAIVSAPGNYTFGIPSNFPSAENPSQGPVATFFICTDTTSVLYIQPNYSGREWVTLTDWAPVDGSSPPPQFNWLDTHVGIQDMDGSFAGFPNYLSTHVPVPPGCGKLRWATGGNEGAPYVGPPTVTVSITKSAPAS